MKERHKFKKGKNHNNINKCSMNRRNNQRITNIVSNIEKRYRNYTKVRRDRRVDSRVIENKDKGRIDQNLKAESGQKLKKNRNLNLNRSQESLKVLEGLKVHTQAQAQVHSQFQGEIKVQFLAQVQVQFWTKSQV